MSNPNNQATNGINIDDIEWALGKSAWSDLLGRIELKKEVEKQEAIIAQQAERITKLEVQEK